MARIHFPPATLQKLCKTSTHIWVLSVERHDKKKGVVVFKVLDRVKVHKSTARSFRHVIR